MTPRFDGAVLGLGLFDQAADLGQRAVGLARGR